MNREELIQLYQDFFSSKNHAIISGRSLVPENDPTILFTTAGMHPLVPYLQGQEHPQGKRLANVQRCIRTGDIEAVGDSSHLTFFEMLGNWSLGDYFKEESIQMSYEFLTSSDYLNLSPERLSITIFSGDEEVECDEESRQVWLKLGIPAERIFPLGREDNWWGPVGDTGPCGPDTEIFYDTGLDKCSENCAPGCSCGKFLEIWNNVFMQYVKEDNGSYSSLPHHCVDTGMGVERTVMILNGEDSVYDTDAFQPIIEKICSLASLEWRASEKTDRSIRILSDHLKAAVMMLGDDQQVLPSNVGRGYVLRRLIRRGIQHGIRLGLQTPFLSEIGSFVIDIYEKSDPSLGERRSLILKELTREEEIFSQAIKRGEAEFSKLVATLKEQNQSEISGRVAFRLYDTFGFPLAMTTELASENGLTVDEAGFEKAFKKHQEVSRQGASQSFKGGLAGDSEQETRYHTATHLLNEALRIVLGPHVKQRGSNITPDRMRFDFSHDEKMSAEELQKVEKIVNEKIEADLPISMQTMPIDEAKKMGAQALFEDKYSEIVKVYSIGDFSHELCGGPHTQSTKELGHFKIEKEQSSSRGVRRIKAVLKSS